MKIALYRKSCNLKMKDRLGAEKALFEKAFDELGWSYEHAGHIVPANSMTRANWWKVDFHEQENPLGKLPYFVGDVNYFLFP